MTFTLGIDTSTHQDNAATPQRIDWAKPAALGVKFVINRVAFCAARDEDFDYNWAQQRGRYLRGGYGFWGYWPGAPAISLQVQAVVNALKADPGEFPLVWADVEKASASYPEIPEPATALPSLEAYMKGIEDGLGLGTGIYTNIAGILRLSPIPRWLLDKPLWLAWPLTPSTGETVEAYIERTGIRPPLKEWSGFKIWQFSWKGPGKEAGMESYGLDMNYYNGSESDLRAWCKQEAEEPPMDWTQNAVGLYTKTAGWTNPDFDFIVGYAGGDWSQRSENEWVLEPNQNLKPIETQAHAEKKPFLALWDFDVSWYSLGQIDAREDSWPKESSDYPLQALIHALEHRDVDGLIIRVMNYKNRLGKDESGQYIAFAARKFCERANRWLYTNKGLDKWAFVLSSDSFFRIGGKQEHYYTWTRYWFLGLEKEATRPLKNAAWPQDTDQTPPVPPSLGWKLWYHYNATTLDMMIWNGPAADMRAFLGYTVEAPTPPQPVSGLTADYANDSVSLTWQPVAGAVRYDIDVDGVAIKSVEEAACAIDGLTPGTYSFGVVAVGPTGLRSSRVVVTVPAPDVPEDLLPRVRELERQMALVLEWLAGAPRS